MGILRCEHAGRVCSRLQLQRRRLRVLQAGSAGPTSQMPNLLHLNVTDPSILRSSPASAGVCARPPQVARIQRRHAAMPAAGSEAERAQAGLAAAAVRVALLTWVRGECAE